MSDGTPRKRPGHIGPWRLLDLVQATMPWRAGLAGGGGALPEFGPPDSVAPVRDPEQELPESNLSESEQQQAIARESFRRGLASQRRAKV